METKLAFKTREGKMDVLQAYDSLLEHWPSPNEKLNVKHVMEIPL